MLQSGWIEAIKGATTSRSIKLFRRFYS